MIGRATETQNVTLARHIGERIGINPQVELIRRRTSKDDRTFRCLICGMLI
jgi:hypothetical protein